MDTKTIVKEIEKKGPYKVLKIYDFDSDNYLVSCENRITKNRIGDFFYTVEKKTGVITGYNPSIDPFEFGSKMRKSKVIYSA